MSRDVRVAVFAAAILLTAAEVGGAVRTPDRAYRLFTVLESTPGRLSGLMRLSYRHTAACPTTTLVFLLVPNRLATPPRMPVEQLDAIYPKGFEPGSLDVSDVYLSDGTPLRFATEGVRLEVTLPAALAPGATVEVALAFTTAIPVAQGLIGRLEGVLRVQGGFHPLLAAFDDADCDWRTDRVPPPATFTATFAAPPGVTVASAGTSGPDDRGDPAQTIRYVSTGRWLPLIASPRYRTVGRQVGPVRLEAFWLPGSDGRIDHLLDVATGAIGAFEARHGTLRAGTVLRLAEVPHAFGVASSAEGVILFDLRLGKVLDWLKPFHDRQLRYRVFEALWRIVLAERGASPPPWVLEALAAIEIEATRGSDWPDPPRFERVLSWFGFIPIVDEFLYSDRVPDRTVFRQQFTVVEDPHDLARLDGPRLGGVRIVRKLEAMLSRGALDAAAAAYTADPLAADFVSVLSAHGGRDLDAFVTEWTAAPKAADYALEVATRPLTGTEETARHETTIRVTARPPDEPPPLGAAPAIPVQEPVPVVVAFGGGEIERVVLESPETMTVTFRTTRPFEAAEIDPDLVTEDRWRADNRVPPRWRILLTEFSASLDIREGEISFTAGGTAERGREAGPVYGLLGFRDQQSAGVTLSLGLRLPPLGREVRHGLTFSATGERLDPEFGPTASEARWITEAAVGYAIDSRVEGRNPLSGGTAGLVVTVSDDALGSDADYVITEARTTRYLRVAPGQALALRAEVGETLDGRPPFGKGLLLGGLDRLRAYPEDAFSGRSLSLASIEYRFPVVRDLDQWVAGLLGIGSLSSVVGVEAGQVSDDHVPFRWKAYRTGLNVGLRFSVRIFGVSPVLWSFDAAMPLSGGPSPGDTRYYISASQSF